MEGKYIYGIIEVSDPHTESFGVGVYTIPYRDISAVVSDSSFVDYTTLPKDQVARYLLRHQQVIEKIMDFYTIIPMKLGTYASNISEVEEILSKGYAMFKDVFRKINNKIEMDVVATWDDLNSVIKEIGEEQDVKKLKEEIMSKPEGISAEDQVMIGSRIKHIIDKKRERCSFEIETVLKDVSIDFRKHDLMDDRMIFNTAFQIEKSKKDKFEEILGELDNGFGGKVNFRCVGPLPLYSFYTIETKRLNFEDVDWARRRLSLNERATKEEIIKAYRECARMHHPDRNPDLPDAERQFNEINNAYKTLLEYCLSAEQAGQGDSCSFKEEEFNKNAFLVKLRE
jgi:HD superfamily phosphohydrolase